MGKTIQPQVGTPEFARWRGERCDYSFYEVKYSTSWDWLLPVVEKIENTWIDGAKSICKIQGNRVEIYHTVGYKNTDFATNHGYNGENYDKITSVYKAVVDFIKWYNENKQK